MEKCIGEGREHFSYLIVMVAHTGEYSLIQAAGRMPCLNGNLRVTFDNNVRR